MGDLSTIPDLTYLCTFLLMTLVPYLPLIIFKTFPSDFLSCFGFSVDYTVVASLNACFSEALCFFLLTLVLCVWDPDYRTGIVPSGLAILF